MYIQNQRLSPLLKPRHHFVDELWPIKIHETPKFNLNSPVKTTSKYSQHDYSIHALKQNFFNEKNVHQHRSRLFQNKAISD